MLLCVLARNEVDRKNGHSSKKYLLSGTSQGKLKLANSRWQTSKSWQTRTFTRQTRVKSQHTVICNMADLVQWHSRRTVEQKKTREETESGGEKERFGQNPVCPLAPPFSFVCF